MFRFNLLFKPCSTLTDTALHVYFSSAFSSSSLKLYLLSGLPDFHTCTEIMQALIKQIKYVVHHFILSSPKFNLTNVVSLENVDSLLEFKFVVICCTA